MKILKLSGFDSKDISSFDVNIFFDACRSDKEFISKINSSIILNPSLVSCENYDALLDSFSNFLIDNSVEKIGFMIRGKDFCSPNIRWNIALDVLVSAEDIAKAEGMECLITLLIIE